MESDIDLDISIESDEVKVVIDSPSNNFVNKVEQCESICDFILG